MFILVHIPIISVPVKTIKTTYNYELTSIINLSQSFAKQTCSFHKAKRPINSPLSSLQEYIRTSLKKIFKLIWYCTP